VLWTQSLICFAIWVAYGVWLWRRIRSASSPGRRWAVFGGPLLLLGGVVLLAAGFFVAEKIGGLGPHGLTSPGWLIVALSGAAFVHGQTLAFVWMAGLAQVHVTSSTPSASSKQDSETNP
jgi:hypothetical protein